jgi:HK97 family phage prohead protease
MGWRETKAMLHKDFSLEIKALSDEGVIEGYASTFGGAPDLGGDVVVPGAFVDSLADHKRKGTMPLMLFGHNATDGLPIGNWVDMAEDGKGLWAQGQLDMEDPFGSKIHRKLKQKQMRGLSIGYGVKASGPDPKRPGVRLLQKLELYEVSVVNMPMNTRAAVDTVKSYTTGERLPPHTDFDELLREAGFSKSQRSVILGKGYLHLLRSESGTADEEVAEFLRVLRS